jgi:anti-sigma B factor antagonist
MLRVREEEVVNREFLVDMRDHTAYVLLTGELDLAAAPAISRAIDRAIRMPVEAVVVDLTAVTFLDSTGVGCLVNGRQRALDAGLGYHIGPSSAPIVARVLEVTGMDTALEVDPLTEPDEGQAIRS